MSQILLYADDIISFDKLLLLILNIDHCTKNAGD